MKRFGLIVALLSCSYLASAATWMPLGDTVKVKYEYDQETVKNPYSIWIKQTPKGNDFPDIGKIQTRVEIACVSDKYTIHQVIAYGKDGEVIQNRAGKDEEVLVSIPPDSIYDSLHKVVCTKEFM